MNWIAVFLFLISVVECTIGFDLSEYFVDDDKIEPGPISFTKAQRVEQFVKTISAFEVFNLKQKYELGRTIAHIIHNMKMEKAGGAVKKSKSSKKYEEAAAVESDVIDADPEQSWRTAENYIKAYKDKHKPENEAERQMGQSGWSLISTNLRKEPVYVRSKVLIRAIADEEVALVKRLVQEKYSVINIEKYNFAIRNYKEKGTENCEAIVDFIERSNPELGAAISRNDKLLAGWDQFKVLEYIYENNYPMLRRALDDGFDPNFVYEGRGSLLGISVVAGCYRCVRMLIERNVDVNEPILFDEKVKVKGWGQAESVSVKGWTPLMFAVADGNVRIVKELIESGTALVSKTANGQEESRFHARAVARRIKDEELRKQILENLKLNSSELRYFSSKIENKDFVEVLKSNDIDLVDSFLLMRSNLDYSLDQIPSVNNLNESISKLLRFECIKRN